ncbi:Insulin-like growth factor-binding protein 5 [Microtus ochrogaster]|uniref:Insulin-like growth factor-binding protein 5 n=1 Tax=Microtus ochrogaster TaxID=79684 RepID=A0A8J6KVY9_MICOH|nr:Insulin-like growth factor-binding protein 5 [Microtus ochrogaster]
MAQPPGLWAKPHFLNARSSSDVAGRSLPPCDCLSCLSLWRTQDLSGLLPMVTWVVINRPVVTIAHVFLELASRIRERDSREHEEPTTSEMAEETYSPKVFRPKHTRISELKAEAVKKDRRKKLTQSKFVGGAENTAHSRVVPAPEMRQESEQGPCRRHMEASLQELKASPRMVPRAVYLPNCDRKGFYKRKQCKPSRGRKRGICWCVDKYGMKLPGMEYVDGDFQCHSFDSSNVE